MKVSAGMVVYSLGKIPCSGVGLQWSNDELNHAMDERVAAIVFDDKGTANIDDILAGLVGTDFSQEQLRRTFERIKEVDVWRIGEATAQAYLTDHRSCSFPWMTAWDEKKRGASMPGADLVGFGRDTNGDCFAFGEVKTSQEDKYPPRVIYGYTGLKKQLENLRDSEEIRRDLVLYLSHRAKHATWHTQFKSATKRYINNTSDVQIYGILIRDVQPGRMICTR